MRYFYNLGKKKLFPICRSLTGKGNQVTLSIIKKIHKKLKILRFKSGSKVHDWKVPDEWNVRDDYFLDNFNKKIIDFKKNNLHLVGYSTPQNKYLEKERFLEHLHTFLSKNAIPYVTSYYKKYWGFCESEKNKRLIKLKYKKNDKFKILIDTKFNKKGKMLVGEYLIKGNFHKKFLYLLIFVIHPLLMIIFQVFWFL